jgi:hypothetical protein
MRLAALTLIGSLALAGVAASASAAPAVPNLPSSSNLIQVSGGCGPGYHPNGWGYCTPNYYSSPAWYGYGYGPYYSGVYYGGYYPRHHHHHRGQW